MTKTRLWRALLLLLAGTVVATGLSAPLTARAEDPAKVLLLLDVSGSMNEKISSGGTKFAAAKRALKQVADALPAGTDVGLRVYGSEIAEPKAENPKACQDTKLVMPIGPLDRTKMYKAVDSFQAVGETPIAYSLGKAVDDLGDSGRRVLVLISDGEESCAGDPCPVARKLADKGVDLQFNAVGLDVGGKARKQLKCIAEAGNGSYYDADESDDLSEALRKITQRALRPVAITGTRVTGTESPDGAPELTTGQYQDRFGPDGGERFYRITRRPGETMTVSVNSLVQPTKSYNREDWSLKLSTDGGEVCDEVDTLSETADATVVVSGAVVSGTKDPACTTAPLVLSVERGDKDGAKTAGAEILVTAEPEITNLASLPEAVSVVRADWICRTGEETGPTHRRRLVVHQRSSADPWLLRRRTGGRRKRLLQDQVGDRATPADHRHCTVGPGRLGPDQHRDGHRGVHDLHPVTGAVDPTERCPAG